MKTQSFIYAQDNCRLRPLLLEYTIYILYTILIRFNYKQAQCFALWWQTGYVFYQTAKMSRVCVCVHMRARTKLFVIYIINICLFYYYYFCCVCICLMCGTKTFNIKTNHKDHSTAWKTMKEWTGRANHLLLHYRRCYCYYCNIRLSFTFDEMCKFVLPKWNHVRLLVMVLKIWKH